MLAARAAGGGNVGSADSPHLVEGPLVAHGGSAPAPQPSIDGVRLDEVVGTRFALAVRDRSLIDADAAAWWATNDAVVLDVTGHAEIGELLDALGTDTAVVRPDRYVLTVGDRVRMPGTAAVRLLSPTQ